MLTPYSVIFLATYLSLVVTPKYAYAPLLEYPRNEALTSFCQRRRSGRRSSAQPSRSLHPLRLDLTSETDNNQSLISCRWALLGSVVGAESWNKGRTDEHKTQLKHVL